ncbi:MAG: hypothetical protein MRZ79_15890 [Bacteroidia bacterium]|nr:hypothetical protein [Bacteroidia bacterium]
MKENNYLQIIFSAVLSLISLAILTANVMSIKNILGNALLGVAVGVITWIGKRRTNAIGIWIGVAVFVLSFLWIDQMGWLARE